MSWTGDSAAETIRVPIWTPSAPKAKAAAIEAPSVTPPAPITGTPTLETTSGNSTIVATSRGFLNPPPSPPSTTRPSTPASTAFNAPFKVGTTWKTTSPAAFSWAVYCIGFPAEVVTKRTPWSTTKSTMAGIADEGLGDVYPEWFVGQIPHLADFFAYLIQLARGSFDDSHGTGVRDRRGQLRPGDPAHRRLHYRDLDAKEGGDTVVEAHGPHRSGEQAGGQ